MEATYIIFTIIYYYLDLRNLIPNESKNYLLWRDLKKKIQPETKISDDGKSRYNETLL